MALFFHLFNQQSWGIHKTFSSPLHKQIVTLAQAKAQACYEHTLKISSADICFGIKHRSSVNEANHIKIATDMYMK